MKRFERLMIPLLVAPALIALPSCARVTVDPIEVKPIHIVHDINIRVERELDEFFAFERAATQPAATQPAAPAAAATQPVAAPAS